MRIELVDTLDSRLFQIRTPPELPFKYRLPNMLGYADAEDKRDDPFVLGWKIDVWFSPPVNVTWQYDERGALLDLSTGGGEGTTLNKIAIYTFDLVDEEEPSDDEPGDENGNGEEPPDDEDGDDGNGEPPDEPPLPEPDWMPSVISFTCVPRLTRPTATIWGNRELIWSLPKPIYMKLFDESGFLPALEMLREEIEAGNYSIERRERG